MSSPASSLTSFLTGDHGTLGLTSVEAAGAAGARRREPAPASTPSVGVPPFHPSAAALLRPDALGGVGLAFLAGLPELGIAIFGVIVLNALCAFVQETRADRAAERLRALLPGQVTVRRNGRRIRIEATDVVTGDILVLEPGDRVPADAAAVIANRALVDTSMVTGESQPMTLGLGETLFAGDVRGRRRGRGGREATGGATRLAEIAGVTTLSANATSPLTLELHRVVRVIAAIAPRAEPQPPEE